MLNLTFIFIAKLKQWNMLVYKVLVLKNSLQHRGKINVPAMLFLVGGVTQQNRKQPAEQQTSVYSKESGTCTTMSFHCQLSKGVSFLASRRFNFAKKSAIWFPTQHKERWLTSIPSHNKASKKCTNRRRDNSIGGIFGDSNITEE